MSDAPPEQQAALAIARDGSRVWIAEPLDSPYAIRLRRFGAHWDFDSSRWWVGITKAAALENLLKHPLGTTPADEPEPERCQQRSAAALLVDMACEDYTLGVTDTGDPYGTHRDTPHLALMLRGGKTGLRAELARRYWDRHKAAPPQQALADAGMVLEGMAAQEDPQRVYLRVAERSGTVYIDMGDTAGHVIEISGGTWEIGIRAPVLFRRTKLTGELPKPFADGDVSRLWEFVPVPEDDRLLLLAWLIQAMLESDTAHPVLSLVAEMGGAKSTVTRCVVDLIDPSPVPLRKAPRDADGWVTAANASWLVALDNLSGELADWLSDSLCRAVTGDGDVRRALYTDQDVSVIAFRRVPIINGIDIQVTQGDLADRILRVDLPRVTKRRDDAELAAAWAKARPDILGGLLTLAAQVHHRLPAVTVTDSPRMASFARVLAAVDEIFDTASLDRYREQSKRTAADTLDAPFIAELVERRLSFTDNTSAEILAALTPAGPDWKPPREWPKNARAVTGQLTRHAPALRGQGWAIDHDAGRNEAGTRKWTISPPEIVREPGPSSPSTPSVHVNSRKPAGLETGHGSETGYDNLFDPSENSALTSDDGSTGQTGHNSGPSPVQVPTTECRYCGGELHLSGQRQRGFCGQGACVVAAREQTPEGGR
jgi:hypothetical protein